MEASISVVIPYFNNFDTIVKTLESIGKQTCQPLEVILINDNSTEWNINTKNHITKAFQNIIICHHDNNKGGGAARNTGIKRARGKYIAFLDADDEWKESHLSDAIDFFKKYDSDLVYSQCVVKTKNKSSVMPLKPIASNTDISEYLFVDRGFIATPSIIIKSSFAKENLFNEKLIRHQDYDFLLRLNKKNIKIGCSMNPSVIVHWENNNPETKGGTIEFSKKFAIGYKPYFTKKAYSYFLLKNVVIKYVLNKNYFKGFFFFIKNIKFYHLKPKEYYFLFSLAFFGKIIIPFRWKK